MNAHVYYTGALILDADDMHIHSDNNFKTTCTFTYHKQTVRGVAITRKQTVNIDQKGNGKLLSWQVEKKKLHKIKRN